MSSMSKSRVVQIAINDVAAAAVHFSRREAGGGTPIVLVPSEPCCFSCCVTIPDGCWILHQKWYEDQGALPAGFIAFWPGWMRVSHIVTKKGISYNHPVFNCPTSDNVMVEVDVSLTFQIGPTMEDAQKFVYLLGAHRFDELLSAETEEAIRALVNDVPVMKVHDLREEFAGDMRDNLNKTMRPYGVEIRAVKVTDVKLPQVLENTLQKRTSYETEIEQEEKKHIAEKRKLVDYAMQQLEEIKKTNKRKVQELNANKDRALVSREEQITAANTNKSVSVVNAQSAARVRVVEAESKKDVANRQGEKSHVEIVVRTKASCDAKRIASDQDYQSRVIRSAAKLEMAKNEAKGTLAEAEVEKAAAAQLQEQRDFEVTKLRMDVLTGIAQHSNMVICGDTGEKLLQQFAPGGVGDMSSSLAKSFGKGRS